MALTNRPGLLPVGGLVPTALETLDSALREVLDAVPTMLYGDPIQELTDTEREVLVRGSARLDAAPQSAPLAATTVRA